MQDESADVSWRSRVYGGSGEATSNLKRRRASAAHRRRQLKIQNGRCFWCYSLFGSHIRRGNEVKKLSPAWDHMIPHALRQRSPDLNFVAACALCNGIKGALVFDTEDAARAYILSRRYQKGWEPVELQ